MRETWQSPKRLVLAMKKARHLPANMVNWFESSEAVLISSFLSRESFPRERMPSRLRGLRRDEYCSQLLEGGSSFFGVLDSEYSVCYTLALFYIRHIKVEIGL